MSPQAWPVGTTWHAPGIDGLMGSAALCGATSDDKGGFLRLHSSSTEVTCAECRRILCGGAA